MMSRPFILVLFLIVFGSASPVTAQDRGSEVPFVIEVVDTSTGRGVPLVKLTTVHSVDFYTDNAGTVTITDPELQGIDVFLHLSSHGYEFPKDGFGYRGVKLRPVAGERKRIEIERINIAERLYRVTGAGLYDHSIAAGRKVPLQQPLRNAGVFGCDSVQTAIWNGKLFWIWGDTNRSGYPLGNFQATAATSQLPGRGGLDPAVGIDFRYFEDETGFVKKIAPMPGEGPTWLSGLTVLPDSNGKEHLVAHFVKVKGMLDVYRKGLCEWDAEVGAFRELLVFPGSQKLHPDGHSFRVTEDGREYLVFADPVPHLRIPATYEAWKDFANYERVDAQEDFHDADSGKRVLPHRGTIAWNDHRKRWIMIFTETKGEASYLGEVWYAESKNYRGPWTACARIVSHDHYSFYNPKQHPWFSSDGGRFVYFEGTYTATFSKTTEKTPKYDYNQIMYRLDLEDDRLSPAQAE
ncbi:MAG: hypothetical protein P1U87_04185 [Verrucomicrobiales bacterium]|nr:hypothetical protein [Verrucomicrobiales bacterium]